MSITANGWKNKKGTAKRTCKCGSWMQHWINYSKKNWSVECSVLGCKNSPNVGAHIINSDVSGEKIVPMCDSCNKATGEFSLKSGVTLVNANVSETCGK